MEELRQKYGNAAAAGTRERVNSFIQSVYGWMSAGLALTGLMAYTVAGSETLLRLIVGNQLIFFGLIIGELAMVFILSSRVQKMSPGTATAMFIGYSVLNGLTLSVIFIAYSSASIASTFFVCAGTFGAVSIYGMTTKKDLTGVGNFMFMGLIGIIIASVVNMFVQSGAISMFKRPSAVGPKEFTPVPGKPGTDVFTHDPLPRFPRPQNGRRKRLPAFGKTDSPTPRFPFGPRRRFVRRCRG